MTTKWVGQLLRNPLIRIMLALLAIAIPFAIVVIPFNLYVSDKILKKAGGREQTGERSSHERMHRIASVRRKRLSAADFDSPVG